MERATAYNRIEMLQVADTVAREKCIDREQVLEAMEQAIQKAGRAKYGHEYDIRADIDRQTGEIRLLRYRQVADPIENEATQIAMEDAAAKNPDAEIGDFITDPLPPIDFGRIAAQTAKQVIVQSVRDAERKRQFGEYKDRVGEIVNGIVKRVEFGNVVVDLGRAEAILRRDECIPRESFTGFERVRAYIYDVREETRGPADLPVAHASAVHGQAVRAGSAGDLRRHHRDQVGGARPRQPRQDRGHLATTAAIDPVGACVGMRGSRVQAVVGELQGEKIDIIPWSPDPATFVVNALAPAEVAKVVIDEEQRRIEVVVPDDQLSLAIGRRGQNVRLASHADRLGDRHSDRGRGIGAPHRGIQQPQPELFIDALDVDDVIAHLLVTEGFAQGRGRGATSRLEDLAEIEGFDESVADELQERARNALERGGEREDDERATRSSASSDDLAALEGMTPACW